MSLPLAPSVVVQPVGGDLVVLARCHALDASVFPFPSIPYVLGSATSLWYAHAAGATTDGAPEVLGFLAAGRRGAVLEIESLAVAEDRRRAGAGRALLRAAIADARARRFAKLSLHVSTGNAAALALYRSEGFRSVRVLRRFYTSGRFPDGGDAFLMVLGLR